MASIQARMGSRRLPGKVLMNICGKPMLLWHVERVKRSRLLDDVIVATTCNKKDDVIALFCKKNAIACYRGSEDNVLNRVASLIKYHEIDVHVELCGDSPLIDPQLIDEYIGYFLKHQNCYDYVSNAINTTYPPGQEVSVYKGSTLCELDQTMSDDDLLREHVGYNISCLPDKFRLASLSAPDWYHEPEAYLEVDTPIDLEMMKKVIAYFSDRGIEHFTLSQILDFLKEHPAIMQLNSGEVRRWKSLRADTDA